MSWMRWCVVGTVLGVVVACGSDSKFVAFDGGGDAAGGTSGVGGDAGAAGEAGSSGEAGTGGTGATDASGGAAGSSGSSGGPSRLGRLTLSVTTNPGLTLVGWFDGPEGHLEKTCNGTSDCVCRYSREGSCFIDTCAPGALSSVAPTPGRIVVENLATQISVEIAPDTEGQYSTSATAFQSFAVKVGDRLRVSAIGKEVPGFEATLTLGDRIQVLEPDPTRSLELSRTEPLLVRWAAGPVQVRADVSTTDADGGATTSALCTLVGANRRAEIPASALAPLYADPAAATRIYSLDSADVVAGDWGIRVSLVNGVPPIVNIPTVVR